MDRPIVRRSGTADRRGRGSDHNRKEAAMRATSGTSSGRVRGVDEQESTLTSCCFAESTAVACKMMRW